MTASTLVDLVKIAINTTGTGTLTLGSALAAFRGVEALSDGMTYSYSIQQFGNYEIGTGVYSATPSTLTRGVQHSSNGGTAIDLSANAVLTVTVLATDYLAINAAAIASVGTAATAAINYINSTGAAQVAAVNAAGAAQITALSAAQTAAISAITTAQAVAIAAIDAASSSIISSVSTLGVVLPYLPTPADVFADFKDTKYYFQGFAYITFGTFLTGVTGTFARSGTEARYVNSSGLLVNGTANTLRITYDPTTLRIAGALIEPLVANMMPFSQNYAAGGTAWSFSDVGTTRADGVATGVDGTTSAGKIAEDTSTGIHRVFYYGGVGSGDTVASGQGYADQLFVKAGGRTKFILDASGSVGWPTATVDLTAGTITGTGWVIEPWPAGWFRIWYTGASAATGAWSFTFNLLNAAGASSYTGDGTSGILLSGGMMEHTATVGVRPHVYVLRPDATPVSRQADAMVVTLPAGVTRVTYTLDDASKSVVTVSAGSYPVPTNLARNTIQSLISVDLTTAGVAIETVNGKGGPTANLVKADIPGLTDTDTVLFNAVVTTAKTNTFGGATFRAEGQLFQWTNSALALSSGVRGLILGGTVGQAATTLTNSVLGGPDCFATATVLQNMVAFGDTVGGGSPSGLNSVCLGDEFANGPAVANVVGGGVLGRLGHDSTKTATDAVAWGGEVMRYFCPTRAIGMGARAGRGSTSANGTWTDSGFWGSDTALSATGNRVNVWLYGNAIDLPTATTDNWLNFHDAFKMDLSSGAVTVQKPGGAAATMTVANIAATRVTGTFNPTGFTVATLPVSPSNGDRVRVSNALSPVWGGAVVGGGTVDAPVFYQGSSSSWIVG